MRISKEFRSDQYSSEEDLQEENYRFRVETTITLDSGEKMFEINSREYHNDGRGLTESFGGTFILSDWSDLQDVADLLRHYVNVQDDLTRSITIPLESGKGFNGRLGRSVDGIEEIVFTVDEDRLEVDGKGHRGDIRHYRRSVDFTPQDRRNAIAFLDMVNEIFQDSDEEPILNLKHSDLRSDAVPEYADGHYQSSVRTAFRVLKERIREEGDFSQDNTGFGLAETAFSPEEGSLTFADVGAERKGWMFLYAGGFGALRNPPSHRDEDSIDQHRAKQILNFVDMLLCVLESKVAKDT